MATTVASQPLPPPLWGDNSDRHVRTALSGDNDVAWAPGQPGQGCYGIWTKNWQGHIPQNIEDEINASATPDLLERIKNGQCPFGRALPGQVTWPARPTF